MATDKPAGIGSLLMKCKICDSETSSLGQAQVLGKYAASYRCCGKCAFVFVEEPSWLAESYKSAINRTDIGTIWRAQINSLATKSVIELFFRRSSSYLDYGAGYGAFVRRMRDLGYNFSGYDTYCESIFSNDFQITSLDGRRFDIVSAFEVVEHLEHPLQFFDEVFEHTDTIFFSTEIISDPPPALGKWWYYGLDHGQHISLFSRKSLEHVAARHNKHYLSNGSGLHLLTSRSVNRPFFKYALSRRFCKILDLLRSRPSLLPVDFEALRKQHFEKIKNCNPPPR
jgi:hypothetical protein